MPAKRQSNLSSTRSKHLVLPRWITIWMIVTSVCCLWDCGFVLNRPRSMRGGDLFHLFAPYTKYIAVDPLYANMENAFVLAQSWLNLIEVAFGLVSLSMYYFAGRHNLACLLLWMVNMMTWAKTVLYFVHNMVDKPLHPELHPMDITSLDYWLFFIIPNSLWIIFPLACIVNIARQILKVLNEWTENTKNH